MQPESHRQYSRVPVKIHLRFRVAGRPGSGNGTVSTQDLDWASGSSENLSAGGLLLCHDLNQPLFCNDILKLDFELPDHYPFKAFGEIVWAKPQDPGRPSQAGVHFIAVRDEDAAHLARFVEAAGVQRFGSQPANQG